MRLKTSNQISTYLLRIQIQFSLQSKHPRISSIFKPNSNKTIDTKIWIWNQWRSLSHQIWNISMKKSTSLSVRGIAMIQIQDLNEFFIWKNTRILRYLIIKKYFQFFFQSMTPFAFLHNYSPTILSKNSKHLIIIHQLFVYTFILFIFLFILSFI